MDNDGNLLGQKHKNLVLAILIFVLEFPDGYQHGLGYSVLAESKHRLI